MKYYAVAELDIVDPSWVGLYVKNVTRLVESHGGRYLARTSSIEKLEGDRQPPQIVLLVEWPSREAAMTFFDSDEYRPYRRQRVEGARSQLLLVAGEDVAGRARIAD
jgi:uncharacterized protein (DUF1330 family)